MRCRDLVNLWGNFAIRLCSVVSVECDFPHAHSLDKVRRLKFARVLVYSCANSCYNASCHNAGLTERSGAVPIPEPSALLLSVGGMVAVGAHRRRQHRNC